MQKIPRDPFAAQMADFSKFPPVDDAARSAARIAKAIQWMKREIPNTSAEEIDSISQVFLDACKTTTAALWLHHSKVATLMKNPAFAEFMQDHGAKSKYFVPWLTTVPSSLALEAAYGRGLNLYNEYCLFEQHDPFFLWTVRDDVFIYLRERSLKTAELVRGKDKVAFLGAGYLPELRYMGLEHDDLPKEIIACDSDQTIKTDILYKDLGEKLTYVSMDLMQFLSLITDNHGIIAMNGVLSYHTDWIDLILDSVIPALKVGGTFTCDLQLRNPNLLRNALMFGWQTNPQMTLMENADAATSFMEQACHGRPVHLDCHIDSRNSTAVGVIFNVHRVG